MFRKLAAAALPSVLIAAFASPAMAQTAAVAAPTIDDVLRDFSSKFVVTLNGQALSTLSFGQIVSGLAANLQIAPKSNGLSVITLKNDVSVDIRANNNPLSAPIANFTFLKDSFRLDPDPAVSYGLSVRNLTNGTQSYAYTWPLLFSPVVTGPTSVKSSLTGTLTDLGGSAGAAIAPTIGTKIQSSIVGATPLASMGVDVGDATSFGTANGSQNFAFYNPGPAPGANYAVGPVGSGLTFMTVTTAFSLTARDRVSMTGFSEILPIPEPSTYALTLVGLGLAAVAVRRANAPKL